MDLNKILLDKWRPYAWILALCILLFGQTVLFKFVLFDDNALILDNYRFISNIANIPKAFTTDVLINSPVQVYYRPFGTVFMIMETQIARGDPAVYHATNILLHAAFCALLFAFLQMLSVKRRTAFILTSLFLIHPALVQNVAWIPGRQDVLFGAIGLGAFILLVKYLETRKKAYLWAHLLAFLLLVFTKELALVFAGLFALYILLFRNEDLKRPEMKIFIAGWAGAALLWLVLRSLLLKKAAVFSFGHIFLSFFANIKGIVLFAGKILIPVNLSVLPVLSDSTLVYGWAALIIMAIYFIFIPKDNKRLVVLGLVWAVAVVLPSFIRPDSRYAADFLDTRLYLPISGLLIAFCGTRPASLLENAGRKVYYVLAVLMALVAVYSFIYTGNFREPIRFWENAVKNSPNYPLARRNLGAMYYLSGNIEGAQREYLKTIQLNPNEPMVYNNLGLIFALKNMPREAEQAYMMELKINPDYDNALFNLGLLYARAGIIDRAEALWLRTVMVNPEYLDAYTSLAILFYNKKEYTKAVLSVAEVQRRGGRVSQELLNALAPYVQRPGN